MKNPILSHLRLEDDFQSSNTVLHLKPTKDHQTGNEPAGVSPEIEMQWLKTTDIKVPNPDEGVHYHNALNVFTTTLVNHILSKEWNESSDVMFAEAVTLHGRTYTRSGISSIISFFQACHLKLELKDFTIHNIHVDLEDRKAAVRGDIVYCATHSGMEREVTEGPCILHFVITSVGWNIVQMEIPGL